MGHDLHRRGPGADDGHALVGQPVEPSLGAAAGIGVVPPAGVEGVTAERADAVDPGQLGPVQRAGGRDHEAGPEAVAPRGVHGPAARDVVPVHVGDLGAEQGARRQPVVVGDAPGMVEDLRGVCVALGGNDAELLEQGQVDVGLDVALGSRVLVPVPGAADTGPLLDQAHVVDAGPTEPGPGEQAAEAAPHHDGTHLLVERGPVGYVPQPVGHEPGVVAGHLEVLVLAVGAQAPLPLLGVAAPQRVGVEAEVGRGGVCHGRSLGSAPAWTPGRVPVRRTVPPGAGTVAEWERTCT